MKKVKYFIFSLICLFSCCVVYAENEVVVESITPVYDEESSVIVTETDDKHNVIFNDKDQSVEYKVVLKNTSNKDLSVQGIKLSTPSEDFLKYELDGLKNNDVVKADSTKEVVISLSTVKQDGWGRNFDDELTATINFGDPIANPNTGTSEVIIVILICGVLISCAFIVICCKKKITRYIVILLAFGSVITVTSAKETFVLPIKINVSYESQNVVTTPYILDRWCDEPDDENTCYTDYIPKSFLTYREYIKNIYIENKLSEKLDYLEKYDISEKQNGKVIAYLVKNAENSYLYDLYLQSDGIMHLGSDASYFFAYMHRLESIHNIEGLDTSNVINMSHMFSATGAYVTNFTLDLSNFDTSNVTNMSYMFSAAGHSNPNFTLDVSSFDTSNVTNMSYMFYNTGQYATNFTLDVSNFDTSNVTNMSHMFSSAGFYGPTFTLDVSNFDTSKVTDMNSMFDGAGYSNPNFTLDVSNFDTSSVTDMRNMFGGTGFSNPNFTLDVSNFDTSKVTDMNSMFANTGFNGTNFTLDVSDFDTSKVTDMSSMFSGAGYSNPNFTLDVSNFDTSNVTKMNWMFENTGYNSSVFTLDLSNFNTSKVTSMWGMFYATGYSNPNFTLDLGDNFDTSKVTSIGLMFFETGYNSTKLNSTIALRNPKALVNMDRTFASVATKPGSKLTLNYTSATSKLVDDIINRYSESNLVKGIQVD